MQYKRNQNPAPLGRRKTKEPPDCVETPEARAELPQNPRVCMIRCMTKGCSDELTALRDEGPYFTVQCPRCRKVYAYAPGNDNGAVFLWLPNTMSSKEAELLPSADCFFAIPETLRRGLDVEIRTTKDAEVTVQSVQRSRLHPKKKT